MRLQILLSLHQTTKRSVARTLCLHSNDTQTVFAPNPKTECLLSPVILIRDC